MFGAPTRAKSAEFKPQATRGAAAAAASLRAAASPRPSSKGHTPVPHTFSEIELSSSHQTVPKIQTSNPVVKKLELPDYYVNIGETSDSGGEPPQFKIVNSVFQIFDLYENLQKKEKEHEAPSRKHRHRPKLGPPLTESDINKVERYIDPYFSIKNITANIDSGLDDHIIKISDPNASKLRAIQLKRQTKTSDTSSSSESQLTLKFMKKDMAYPKKTIMLFEHMLYHIKKSISKKPLEIYIPLYYLIDINNIKEYVDELPDTNDKIKTGVIDVFNDKFASLFYKHTISQKNGDMTEIDIKKTERLVKDWHIDYTQHMFFKNANTFFIKKWTDSVSKEELTLLDFNLYCIDENIENIIKYNAYLHAELNKNYWYISTIGNSYYSEYKNDTNTNTFISMNYQIKTFKSILKLSINALNNNEVFKEYRNIYPC
jgi:hypothetical protein